MAGKDHKENKEHKEAQKSSHGSILKAIGKAQGNLHEISAQNTAAFNKSESKASAQGSFHAVAFGEVSGITKEITKEDKKKEYEKEYKQVGLALSISMPKDEESDQLSDQLLREAQSRAAMRNIQAESPFFLDYYFTKEGVVISPEASKGDLSHSYKNDALIFPVAKVGEVKRSMSQCLLGLKKLHDNNLVHRDIKPENLFVFTGNDGKTYLKIADLEGVAKVNEQGRVDKSVGIIVSKGYHTIESDEEYYETDLRKEDVYAFGKTLLGIVGKEKRGISGLETSIQLEELAKQATDPDPKKRPTIDQIMNHKVWGETPAERKAWFKSIEEEATLNTLKERSNMFAGGYQLTVNPEEGNAINMMTPEQQKANFLLEDLKEKSELLAFYAAGGKSLDVNEIMAIKKNIDAVLITTDDFIRPHKKALDDFMKSEQNAPDDAIDAQYLAMINVTRDLAMMREVVKEHMEQSLSAAAAQYLESGGRKELLLNAVRDAVDEFMSTKPVLEERQSAQRFLDIFEGEFKAGKTEMELHLLIEARGNVDKTPFKALLEKNVEIAFETSNKLQELVLPEPESQSEDTEELSQSSRGSSVTPTSRSSSS